MDNSSKGEKILVAIIILIIILGIGYIIYTFVISDRNFFDNTNIIDQNTTAQNSNKNQEQQVEQNKENISDQMNIDQDKVDEIQEKVETKPKIVEKEIAAYTTTIYDKDDNRVYNIGLAIKSINDKIIKNGEEFSFNDTVGPMDEAHGYKKAVGFDTYGNKIKVAGGGMCQISSTIYNAVLTANLEVIERHPHSRRVYYVPKDKDATIYYGSLDFKFKNNSGSDIKMVASNTNTDVTIKLLKLEEEK